MSDSDAETRPEGDKSRLEGPSDFTAEQRLQELESTNITLREERRRALSDIRYYKEELNALRRETRRLLSELEKARTPPLIVGVIEDILEDDRVVVKASTGPNFVVPIADHVERSVLEVGARVSLTQSNLTLIGVLPASRDPSVSTAEVLERPEVRYKDIGGLKDTVESLREAVEYPLTDPGRFKKLGVHPPKGVLLLGPPGTGKTLLAKAVAGETDATFVRVVASELVQKFIGEGARKVHELFQLARDKSPSILFIDELDAIGARRTDEATASNREVERTLMQLLAEMDGFDPRGEVRILAATNRADILDPALTRPGRFDRIIEVPLPDETGLVDILKIHTKGMRMGKDVDMDAVVRRMKDATGADVQAVCTEAGMRAVRRKAASIRMQDFDGALAKYARNELPTQGEAGVMYS